MTALARRVRLLYCIDNMHIGGTELNALRTMERLDRDRFELRVVCLGAGGGPLLERYHEIGVPVDTWAVPSFRSAQAIFSAHRFARYLREHEIDVLHSHDIFSNVFAVAAARWSGVPGIVASRRWLRNAPSPAFEAIHRMASSFADRIVTNSPSIGRYMQNREFIRAERIVVVPNFVDDESYLPAPAEWYATEMRNLGLADDSVRIGIVANLHPVKDHATLLRAAAILKPEFSGLCVLMVGDGEQRANLEKLTHELRLETTVRFLGRRPHLPSCHHLFDVSVLCSTSEGSPNSLLEAMAAGKPVVATTVGGIPDIVQDGVTGMLIPPADPVALSAALRTMLLDPQRARAMGAAGRKRTRSEYSAAGALGVLTDLYEQLAQSRVEPSGRAAGLTADDGRPR